LTQSLGELACGRVFGFEFEDTLDRGRCSVAVTKLPSYVCQAEQRWYEIGSYRECALKAETSVGHPTEGELHLAEVGPGHDVGGVEVDRLAEQVQSAGQVSLIQQQFSPRGIRHGVIGSALYCLAERGVSPLGDLRVRLAGPPGVQPAELEPQVEPLRLQRDGAP